MIQRAISRTVRELAKGYPAVAITGPRQSGKTTLARMLFPDKPYVSLEDPDIRGLAQDGGHDYDHLTIPGKANLSTFHLAPYYYFYFVPKYNLKKQTKQILPL